MHTKQMGSLRRAQQAGFTLIELIVVIVILGILAATALPKFADMGKEARIAKLEAARGSVSSAVALVRGKWLAGGSTGTSVSMDGTSISVGTAGYPLVTSIAAAAGLADYSVDASTDPGTIAPDSSHVTGCQFTYKSDGTISTITTTGC